MWSVIFLSILCTYVQDSAVVLVTILAPLKSTEVVYDVPCACTIKGKSASRHASVMQAKVACTSLSHKALSDAEIKLEFTKIVMKCMPDYAVETSDLMSLQQLVPPKKKEVKCLLACAYKKEGTFDFVPVSRF